MTGDNRRQVYILPMSILSLDCGWCVKKGTPKKSAPKNKSKGAPAKITYRGKTYLKIGAVVKPNKSGYAVYIGNRKRV